MALPPLPANFTGHYDPAPVHHQPATINTRSPVPAGSGSWANVNGIPSNFYPGSLLLLTNGSVLVHEDNTDSWKLMKPDASGNYADGTWSSVSPSCFPQGACTTYYDPLYYASAVLPDGRVLIEGGEYSSSTSATNSNPNPVDTNQGAIYNPATNSWTAVTAPSTWAQVGDAESAILPNGTLMVADCCDGGNGEALLNATSLSWTATGTNKADSNDEEGWTLLPDGNLLDVDIPNAPATEINDSSTGLWSTGASTVDPVTDPPSDGYEEGPDLLLPGTESVLAVGAGDSTPSGPDEDGEDSFQAYSDAYDTSTGTWSRGPQFPLNGSGYGYDVADGPGAVLPDGDALVMASPGIYETGSAFFDLHIGAGGSDASTITQVAAAPGAAGDSSYYGRMLDLPNGQVLWDDSSDDMAAYTEPGQPLTGWEPAVTGSPGTVAAGDSYSVSGTQLSGLDQGSAYGDDNQDATNYPLVRITNDASGTVTYTTTSGFSSYSIAPGAHSSASFSVPAGTPAGASTLQAVANGIASAPVSVWVGAPQCQPVTASAADGIAGTVHLSCASGTGDQLSYTIVSSPAHGTLGTPGSDGSVSYTPGAGYSGSDSFTYKATGSAGTSTVATVSLDVAQAPTCAAVTASATEGQSTSIKLSCADPGGRTLTYSVVSSPAHGTLSAANGANISYTPGSGYTGVDQFTYDATAADGISNTASVSVNVQAAQSTPGTVTLGTARSSLAGTRLTVPVSCSSVTVACVVKLRLTYTERIKKRIKHGHKTVTKIVTETVTIGSATQTVSGGKGSLTITLNSTGRGLLKRLGTLHAELIASSGGGPTSRRAVVLRR